MNLQKRVSPSTNWADELEAEIKAKLSGARSAADALELEDYMRANVASVKQLLRGIGPDDSMPDTGAGARIVFNMSCKHVPMLCGLDGGGAQATYKNAYDLNKVTDRRRGVDEIIEKVCRELDPNIAKESVYFAAVETTGTGIRFFGDMCLVMRSRPEWRADEDSTSSQIPQIDTTIVVLERNSYDLVRSPVAERIQTAGSNSRKKSESIAAGWVGTWAHDLLDMVALWVLRELSMEKRRWTSGEIAQVVLDDEDYFEVLFPRSFGASEIMEVRTSASDAAAEGDIADRERTGESPGLHELEWRQQRREARRALARFGIPVRVVTTIGRVKGV